MASNRLSFSIALNLMAADFKRGANNVMASLKSMQYQVLGMASAMGLGGLALTDLVQKMVSVARETNKARTALKNISGTTAQYDQNLRYLLGTANKYGQDLNTLTLNFARFSAAGNAAGVSLKEQEKIFSSVTRAATAFGLGGEDANLVFVSLQQMLSKGKISSEELRRQMGEKMPIAMQAMADAAGVSIQQLDKLLKNGELYSKDVLPRFADALNNLIPNVNTDNLETSINRLKTQFTLLTESKGVGKFYKSLVDLSTSTLQGIQDGTGMLVTLVISLVVGKLGSSILGFYNKLNATRLADVKHAELAEVQKQNAVAKRMAAEVAYEEALTEFNNAQSGERVAKRRAMNAALTTLNRAKLAEEKATIAQAEAIEKTSYTRRVKLKQSLVRSIEKAESELARAAGNRAYIESHYEELVYLQKRANGKAKIALQKEIDGQEIFLNKAKLAEEKAATKLSLLQQKAALATSGTNIKAFFANVKLGAIQLFGTLKTLWATFAPMLIISAVTGLVTRFFQLRKEAKEISNIFSDYKKNLAAVTGGEEVEKLKQLNKILNDRKSTTDQIKAAQSELIRMLGLQKGQESQINEVIKQRIGLLEQTAIFDYSINSKLSAVEKKREILDKYGGIEGYNEAAKQYNAWRRNQTGLKTESQLNKDLTVWLEKTLGINGGWAEFKTDSEKVSQYNKTIAASSTDAEVAKKRMYAYGGADAEYVKDLGGGSPPSGAGAGKDKDPLREAEDKYKEELRALKQRLAATNIGQEEYNKLLSDISKEAVDTIAGLQGANAVNNAVYKEALPQIIPELTDFQKEQKKYNERLKEIENLKANGVYDEKAYYEQLADLYDSTLLAAGALDGIGEEGKKFIEGLKEAKNNLPTSTVQKESRDKTFDYKKTERDKLEEELKLEQSYLSELEKQTIKATSAIDQTKARIEELSKAVKDAEIQEDLKKIQDELSKLKFDMVKGAVSGVRNTASSIREITSAIERMNKAFSDTDASGWEQVVAMIDVVGKAVDGVFSAIDAYNGIKLIIEGVAKAKNTEAAITAAKTGVELSNISTVSGAKIAAESAEAAATVTASGVRTAVLAAELGVAKSLMATESAAAYASMPFVGVGLAAGQIAAMEGLIAAASIPKFASGGIVMGNSFSGDKVLARLNSGEMVLNKAQQSTLFRVLERGAIGNAGAANGRVVFEIQGKKLVGLLEQENKRLNRM